MAGPRHLWSGEWERDSAAAAEELAASRPQAHATAQPPPSQDPPPARPRSRSLLRRMARRARSGVRQVRTVRILRRQVLAALTVAVLAAAATFAAVSSLAGAGRAGPEHRGHAWLGVALASSPILAGGFPSGFGGFPFPDGALVAAVTPGGPAADAGISPGDVITQVNGELVRSPQDLEREIAGKQAGDRIEIRYVEGQFSYLTTVTLEARPANQP